MPTQVTSQIVTAISKRSSSYALLQAQAGTSLVSQRPAPE